MRNLARGVWARYGEQVSPLLIVSAMILAIVGMVGVVGLGHTTSTSTILDPTNLRMSQDPAILAVEARARITWLLCAILMLLAAGGTLFAGLTTICRALPKARRLSGWRTQIPVALIILLAWLVAVVMSGVDVHLLGLPTDSFSVLMETYAGSDLLSLVGYLHGVVGAAVSVVLIGFSVVLSKNSDPAKTDLEHFRLQRQRLDLFLCLGGILLALTIVEMWTLMTWPAVVIQSEHERLPALASLADSLHSLADSLCCAIGVLSSVVLLAGYLRAATVLRRRLDVAGRLCASPTSVTEVRTLRRFLARIGYILAPLLAGTVLAKLLDMCR